MAISKKGKRPITVRNMDLLWWVGKKVVSPDRTFFVEYLVAPIPTMIKGDPPCVFFRGPTLRGHSRQGGFEGWFVSPDFGTPEAVTPRFVAEIVGWVIDDGPLPDAIPSRSSVARLGSPLGHACSERCA
ncbi:MAG: hypothetical protein K0V04_24730 [Deltaproteobacteria bacterium]|nr:hypothetical protein [Deltaproteobacteria bacterium]